MSSARRFYLLPLGLGAFGVVATAVASPAAVASVTMAEAPAKAKRKRADRSWATERGVGNSHIA